MSRKGVPMENKSAYLQRPWLKFYPEGVPPDLDFAEQSVYEALDEATQKWKTRTALVFYGGKMSYGELREQVDRFAAALHHLGVKKGDTVALNLLNSPQFVIAYFGVMKLGAIVTPISPVYVSSEVSHQIRDSGAETIVCQDILYGVIEEAKLKFKNVILADICDYLPILAKFMGKKLLKGFSKKMETLRKRLFEHPLRRQKRFLICASKKND